MTLWYRAPEVLLGTTYATPVDIWSCGCIFAELYRRSPLFPGKYETDQLAKIFQVVGTPPLSAWPEDSPVLRNNFVNNLPRNLQDLVPEIDPLALDLLEVSSLLSVSSRSIVTFLSSENVGVRPQVSDHRAVSPGTSLLQ